MHPAGQAVSVPRVPAARRPIANYGSLAGGMSWPIENVVEAGCSTRWLPR